MATDPTTTAASAPAEGTWNQAFAEDAARSIDRMTDTAATACPHCGATRWTWFGKRVLKCSICGQFCYPEGDGDDE